MRLVEDQYGLYSSLGMFRGFCFLVLECGGRRYGLRNVGETDSANFQGRCYELKLTFREYDEFPDPDEYMNIRRLSERIICRNFGFGKDNRRLRISLQDPLDREVGSLDCFDMEPRDRIPGAGCSGGGPAREEGALVICGVDRYLHR